MEVIFVLWSGRGASFSKQPPTSKAKWSGDIVQRQAPLDPGVVLITGASSGIGEGLARAYAAPGRVLALTGRNAERLAAVASACREAGAGVVTSTIDVTARAELAAWIGEVDAASPIDLAIANAGISAGTFGPGERAANTRAIFATNVDGMLNTIEPLVPAMVARGRGQIALMSSLAGFRGLPAGPAYCASKAAVRVYGEGLRVSLARHGVAVSVVCPGYVRSRMTAHNNFPMPFFMETEPAVRIIVRGLARNRARIAFPWQTYCLTRLMGLLPTGLIDGVLLRSRWND